MASHGPCSISKIIPSNSEVPRAIAASTSAVVKAANATLPCSSARITPLRRGIAITSVSLTGLVPDCHSISPSLLAHLVFCGGRSNEGIDRNHSAAPVQHHHRINLDFFKHVSKACIELRQSFDERRQGRDISRWSPSKAFQERERFQFPQHCVR